MTKQIGILIFDDFEPLDVWGFVQAFAIARFLGQKYDDPKPYPFEISFIAETKKPIRSYNGPHAMPDYAITDTLPKLDVLMVPGGQGTVALLENQPVRDWLKAMDTQTGIMASVCTGAAMYASLGLLEGKPAATNHNAFSWVASKGPALWDNVSRWVDAGHYVTSAGVSAGTDMGFYLVSRLAGRAIAEAAALASEYDWHRDPETPIHYA